MTTLYGAFKNRTMVMFIQETDPDFRDWKSGMADANLEIRQVTIDEIQAAYSSAMEVIITHQFGDLLNPERAN